MKQFIDNCSKLHRNRQLEQNQLNKLEDMHFKVAENSADFDGTTGSTDGTDDDIGMQAFENN